MGSHLFRILGGKKIPLGLKNRKIPDEKLPRSFIQRRL